VLSLSGLQCALARKNFLRGKDVPWLFTGTISVRSRFTGPTPVARFSIAVVVLDGVGRKVMDEVPLFFLVLSSTRGKQRAKPPVTSRSVERKERRVK